MHSRQWAVDNGHCAVDRVHHQNVEVKTPREKNVEVKNVELDKMPNDKMSMVKTSK